MDEESRNSIFTKLRCSSNSSTCSTATTANNTSAETINQMICESPMKKERTKSPKYVEDRRDSSESGPPALRFVGLSMGQRQKGKICLSN